MDWIRMNHIIKTVYILQLKDLSALRTVRYFSKEAFDFIKKYKVNAQIR